MRNRCSIQQSEEINCWLDQSPENRLYRPFRYFWATLYRPSSSSIINNGNFWCGFMVVDNFIVTHLRKIATVSRPCRANLLIIYGARRWVIMSNSVYIPLYQKYWNHCFIDYQYIPTSMKWLEYLQSESIKMQHFSMVHCFKIRW